MYSANLWLLSRFSGRQALFIKTYLELNIHLLPLCWSWIWNQHRCIHYYQHFFCLIKDTQLLYYRQVHKLVSSVILHQLWQSREPLASLSALNTWSCTARLEGNSVFSMYTHTVFWQLSPVIGNRHSLSAASNTADPTKQLNNPQVVNRAQCSLLTHISLFLNFEKQKNA